MLANKIDPRSIKKAQKAADTQETETFEVITREWHSKFSPSWAFFFPVGDDVRKIFREAFDGAGLPYFNLHSFRNTLVRLGEQVCRNPEDFKAWSQNLGYEKVLTTFLSYGTVAHQRQGAIIKGSGGPQSVNQTNINEFTEALFKRLRESGMDVIGK